MVRKVALEPTGFHNPNALLRILDGLGVENGRLLVEYPSAWRYLVHELAGSLEETSSNDGKALEVALTYLLSQEALRTRAGVSYDPNVSWVQNFLEHSDMFDLGLHDEEIMATSVAPNLHPLAELSSVPPPQFWYVERDVSIRNTPEALVARLSSLLSLQPKAVFMDPYFRPDNRYVSFLERIFQHVPSLREIVVHTDIRKSETWKHGWIKRLKPILPSGHVVTFVAWRELPSRRSRNSLHARWVINSQGGIRVDKGFGPDKKTNDLFLMSSSRSMQFWQEFGSRPWSGKTYEFAEEFVLTS